MEAEKYGATFLGSREHLFLPMSLHLRQKYRSPAVSNKPSEKSSNIPNHPREPPGTTETRPDYQSWSFMKTYHNDHFISQTFLGQLDYKCEKAFVHFGG